MHVTPGAIAGTGSGSGGDASAANQTTEIARLDTIITHVDGIEAALAGTLAVSGTFWQATQPVSGTFWQATQPVSIAATVAVSNAGLTELASAINASAQMDVNIAASAATLTVASHAVTNAGTFAVQVDGSALTSLQLIDDAIYATDGALNKSMVMGAVFDDVSPVAITENQGGYLRMSSRRALLVEGVASGTVIPVAIASGQVASGAIASGAVASGAFASGSISSGAVASGAIAAGAIASGAAVSGAFADGAIVTLGAKADAKSTATDTTAITIMQVLKQISASVQAPPSQAVTNAGTFAVQDSAAEASLSVLDDWDNTASDGASVTGDVAHDGVDAGEPVKIGGYASAAAPTGVSGDADRVNAWFLRNGAQATVVTAAGALIGGDAANGLDVDVTRLSALVAGSAEIGFVKIASGSIASGAIASGAIASGAIASGAIAVGAIAAGATSIATTEDSPSAGADHLVKIAHERLDTPVANANVSNDGDYLQALADNFGKAWVTGTVPEDTAHVAGEALSVQGSRRIATLASSAGSDADWATVNQTAEGAAWSALAGTATPNGLLVGNFTSGDTYTALTNAAQVIKASAGNLYGYYIYNPNTAATYVEVYNIAAASVTVGTSTAILVFCIPASSAANLMFPVPIPFSNAGWSIAATTTGGGNTAPTTALEAMLFYL